MAEPTTEVATRPKCSGWHINNFQCPDKNDADVLPSNGLQVPTADGVPGYYNPADGQYYYAADGKPVCKKCWGEWDSYTWDD
ncbi:hypothetical protein A3D54_02505 [Candidatus Falkowbacteria bacterium RIFCSPHIGHO2_02_FULL_45_15]|uniref:Uncharacterized protein n=1 Tax=Candidatus Falkowbacteria bacterium RIFCSPHIGHO2_02_FULL_45_15 TaxID=1797987 RepID=A0A1F5RZ05_9BACT|nr:MAG: hypothetical protein A3D54_02505 [Candidatus Falkowbacteria bacterium RIFCSPHIGHO2_02_FULL_45_15]